jgi:hypothetical protein
VRTVVAAPRATIPPHSLIRAAVTNLDGEPGWERGLTYAPETPGGYRALAACTAAEFDDLEATAPTPVVDYEPWELHVEHPCHTTFGLDRPYLEEQLGRALDATESYAIARELWNGDLTRGSDDADGEPLPNLSLVDGPTVLNGGAPVRPRLALGLLEKAVGDALRGSIAYLHTDRVVQQFLGHDLTRDGNLITTRVGNLVVADAGYPGTGPGGVTPADGVGWLYGTGPVVVRRSTVFPAFPDAQTIDTRNNSITLDRAAHFAVAVDLTA